MPKNCKTKSMGRINLENLSHSTCQDIFLIILESGIYNCVHYNPLPLPVLSDNNPTNNLTYNCLKCIPILSPHLPHICVKFLKVVLFHSNFLTKMFYVFLISFKFHSNFLTKMFYVFLISFTLTARPSI